MMRTFTDRGGNVWTVREIDGQFGFEVADLPPVWIDAPRELHEMSDRELIELARAASEGRSDP